MSTSLNAPSAQFVTAAVAASGLGLSDCYVRALDDAFSRVPPVYGEGFFGKEYRRLSRDPQWFASHLVSNADMEGYSGKRLRAFARAVTYEKAAKGLERHAADELRHSRNFARLFEHLFPKSVGSELRQAFQRMGRDDQVLESDKSTFRYADGDVLQSLVLINLFEIKALYLQSWLAPIASCYADDAASSKVSGIMRAVTSDELRHICYSAVLIEEGCSSSSSLASKLQDAQEMINGASVWEMQSEFEHASLQIAGPALGVSA